MTSLSLRPVLVFSLLALLSPAPASRVFLNRAQPSPKSDSDRPAPVESLTTPTPAGLASGFVPNQGQFPPPVRFQLRQGQETWWFTDDAVWLTVLQGTQADKKTRRQGDKETGGTEEIQGLRTQDSGLRTQNSELRTQGVNLRLTFDSSSPNAHWVPLAPLPGQLNYFLGARADRWHTNLPRFASLRWEGLYLGVDLTFGPQGITIQGDTNRLHLHLEGAEMVRVDDNGILLAETSPGSIRLPFTQTADGRPLTARITENLITFSSPGTYHSLNSSRPQSPISNLLSPSDDPADLLYSTFLGGDLGYECSDSCHLQRDSAGFLYVSGSTSSPDFPITPGAFQPRCNTSLGFCYDIFISKFTPNGRSLVFSTFLGGGGGEYSGGLAVGADYTASVTGRTRSTDFPTTPGVFGPTCNTMVFCEDVFVTRLDLRGDGLLYSTYVGGSGFEQAYGIAVGPDGSAYIAGFTDSLDFPTTPGVLSPACNMTAGYCGDTFVTRLSPDGGTLLFSTYLGGEDIDAAYAIAAGPDGSAYVFGLTSSLTFPITPGAPNPAIDLGYCTILCQDTFITHLTADGSALVYSTYLGGLGGEYAGDLFLAADGSVYVTGESASYGFPTTPGAYQRTNHGFEDIFVTKLTPDGRAWAYSTLIGGRGDVCDDISEGIAVDAQGRAVVAGRTNCDSFPTTPGAFQRSYADILNRAIVSRFNADGSVLLYSTYLDGSGYSGEFGYGVAVDDAGTAYIAGYTSSTDFPTTPDAFDPTCAEPDCADAYLTRLKVSEPTLHVAGIDAAYRPAGNAYRLGARIGVRDDHNQPVAGVTVAGQVQRPDGQAVSFTSRTNAEGIATVSATTVLTGTYTFTVGRLQKTGWVYDPAANEETQVEITIP